MTPLQRPKGFEDKATFTPEEAAEFVRTKPDRLRSRLLSDADRATQVDLDDTFVETEAIGLEGLRTSLLVDPPGGFLPPFVPAARARIAARPKRSYDDPESVGLGERCLLANFGLGGSLAGPPMVPSEVIPAYYQIVQTPGYVTIAAEWMHDVRIVRLNSAHAPSSIRKWLGDSIGWYEGSTLVVDTTNFRPDTHFLDSSERMHVVERFTRVDERTLRYRVTVEDPDTWAAPWTGEWPMRRTGIRMHFVECHEGNYAIENFLRGARAEEREAAAPIDLQYDARLAAMGFPSPLVRATVRGETAAFIVDTGASVHTIASWLVDAAKMPAAASRATTTGSTGVETTVRTVSGESLHVAGRDGDIRLGDAIVVDFPPIFAEQRIGGLLSPQLLAAAGTAAVLDLQTPRLTFGPARPATVGTRVCRNESSPFANRLYSAPATIGGTAGTMLVDTGATSSVVSASSPLGAALSTRPSTTSRAQGVGGPATVTRTVPGVSVQAGGAETTVPVAIGNPAGACGADGLIGMDVLRRCVLVLGESTFAWSCK